jgi:type II secretory pathway pseudopilin PulG
MAVTPLTSAAPVAPMHGERGLTMVELLVGSAVMIVLLGLTTTTIGQGSRIFVQQRAAMDNRNSAAASVDMLGRLLRQSSCVSATNVYCQAIQPDPDGNGVFDSVRVQADWNPRDGDLDDPYENVLFVVANNTLWKREPTDAALVAFGDNVQSVIFTYTNQNGGPLANPVARPDLIGGVTITVTSSPAQGLPAVTSVSSVSIRRVK